MSGMSGLDLLRQVHELRMSIKTIVLSSYSSFQYVKTALQYGIENYLLKPVDVDELKSTLSQAVEKLENESRNSYYAHMKESTMLGNTLEAWMKGALNADTLSERLSFYGINPNYRYYITGIISPRSPRVAGEREYEMRDSVVKEIIVRYKRQDSRLIAVWTLDDQLLTTLDQIGRAHV